MDEHIEKLVAQRMRKTVESESLAVFGAAGASTSSATEAPPLTLEDVRKAIDSIQSPPPLFDELWTGADTWESLPDETRQHLELIDPLRDPTPGKIPVDLKLLIPHKIMLGVKRFAGWRDPNITCIIDLEKNVVLLMSPPPKPKKHEGFRYTGILREYGVVDWDVRS